MDGRVWARTPGPISMSATSAAVTRIADRITAIDEPATMLDWTGNSVREAAPASATRLQIRARRVANCALSETRTSPRLPLPDARLRRVAGRADTQQSVQSVDARLVSGLSVPRCPPQTRWPAASGYNKRRTWNRLRRR